MPSRVAIDDSAVRAVEECVRKMGIPKEAESSTHAFKWARSTRELGNAYLAIVAICHQTSPIGERRLEGNVGGSGKGGWDYLKEKFLIAAGTDPSLVLPGTWASLTPVLLSELYADASIGLTLNRVNERALLLNDLGRRMVERGVTFIEDEFDRCGRTFLGDRGFLATLSETMAFSDPVRKKALFYASLVVTEAAWTASDFAALRSPVDYHELRGHLRLGTVKVSDADLKTKVTTGLPVTPEEDVEIRHAVQRVNDEVGERTGLSSSRIHYMMWNMFRECCPRQATATHCHTCPDGCRLPPQYKSMPGYEGRCVFASVCESAGLPRKVTEPPYTGHFY